MYQRNPVLNVIVAEITGDHKVFDIQIVRCKSSNKLPLQSNAVSKYSFIDQYLKWWSSQRWPFWKKFVHRMGSYFKLSVIWGINWKADGQKGHLCEWPSETLSSRYRISRVHDIFAIEKSLLHNGTHGIVDEHLSMASCHYIFRRNKKKSCWTAQEPIQFLHSTRDKWHDQQILPFY